MYKQLFVETVYQNILYVMTK